MKPYAPIDFETLPISQRPDYPPEPVGLALRLPGAGSRYFSWGHVNGSNNATESEAKEALWNVWRSPSVQLLFHNSKFDVGVATERWGFPMPEWHRIEDSMFLAFLADPHSRSAGLKELAADLLDWPAEERDRMAEWIVAHQRQLIEAFPQYRDYDKKKGRYKTTIPPSTAGKWIFAAPAEIVGEYGIGDIDRTAGLFEHLLPLIEMNGMREAYDRERQIMPILMENEREGMRVDLERLESDVELFNRAFSYAEDWLRSTLRASGLNFDADQDVAEVLLSRGIVAEADFPRTAKGALSVSKKLLKPKLFTGPQGSRIASALGYRNRLKTCLTMFMEPWLAQAQQYGGRITTNWNQIRSNADTGTRTGRPSTNAHNFLNISKQFEGRGDGYEHPEFFGSDFPHLPLVRKYVLPDDGEVFAHRDFSGQELRVFAHFEQGDLHHKYQDNPRLDPHHYIGTELERVTGQPFTDAARRTEVKALNFQGIYGGGAPALADALDITLAEAKALKSFHNKALPGRVILNEEITRVIRRGDPIRTWGGRLYFEEPRGLDGRSKIYKLINYLVQGSAADLTKQAIIDWYNDPDRAARFMVTVYDEINISTPVDVAVQQMEVLRRNMEAPRISVALLSDGKWGWSWGTVKKYNDENPDWSDLK